MRIQRPRAPRFSQRPCGQVAGGGVGGLTHRVHPVVRHSLDAVSRRFCGWAKSISQHLTNQGKPLFVGIYRGIIRNHVNDAHQDSIPSAPNSVLTLVVGFSRGPLFKTSREGSTQMRFSPKCGHGPWPGLLSNSARWTHLLGVSRQTTLGGFQPGS